MSHYIFCSIFNYGRVWNPVLFSLHSQGWHSWWCVRVEYLITHHVRLTRMQTMWQEQEPLKPEMLSCWNSSSTAFNKAKCYFLTNSHSATQLMARPDWLVPDCLTVVYLVSMCLCVLSIIKTELWLIFDTAALFL